MKEKSKLMVFVKHKRKLADITQVELAEKADVGFSQFTGVLIMK